MFDKNKNSCNIYDIKKRYLGLIKKGNDLLKQREIEVEKQEKNFIEFNSTYYDLKDVKTKRSVKVEVINSKKGKYVDKKNKKRLIITSVFAYILPVIISSLLTSFKYTSLIPFLGVCGVYVNILFEYLFFQKKYYLKFSKEFEDLEETKNDRKELEDLLLRENELIGLHDKTDEIRKTCARNINNLDKEISLIKEKINLLRVSAFEDLIGVEHENNFELKLSK